MSKESSEPSEGDSIPDSNPEPSISPPKSVDGEEDSKNTNDAEGGDHDAKTKVTADVPENKSPKSSGDSQGSSCSSTLSDREMRFLEELPDIMLVDTIIGMNDELRRFKLENLVFENFLEKNEPAALASMNQLIEAALKMVRENMTSDKHGVPHEINDRDSRQDSIKASLRGSIFVLASDKGPRINITQKTDLVLREMEENQNAFQSFVKKSHRYKCKLKAELEEISIRKSEIQDARNIFEQNVVIEGVDPLTQRIPAEKFIKYMDDWLKSAQAILEKVRLRVSTYKIQYKKVSVQLLQKQELGETLHAVDFEQLQIENKNFLEKIDQKNTHLLELKKMNGLANLVLSTHKQCLQKQIEDLNDLKELIKFKEKKVDDLDKDSETAEIELEAARDKFENMKQLVTSYRVPDVMDYIKKKAELYEVKKNLKVWSRRKHIQDIALKSCIREMKNLTGLAPTASWFRTGGSVTSVNDEYLRALIN